MQKNIVTSDDNMTQMHLSCDTEVLLTWSLMHGTVGYQEK